MKLSAAVLAVTLVAAFAFPAVAGAGKIVLTDTMPRFSSTKVSVTVRKAAAFRVLMRTSTQGRTKLFLLGKHAPKGGPLIDTKTYACHGRGRLALSARGTTRRCRAGTYTFRVVYAGRTPAKAHLELTVRW